jgi:hypothetical protein
MRLLAYLHARDALKPLNLLLSGLSKLSLALQVDLRKASLEIYEYWPPHETAFEGAKDFKGNWNLWIFSF